MPFVTRDESVATRPINGLYATPQAEGQEFLADEEWEVAAFLESLPQPGQTPKATGGIFRRLFGGM